MFEQIIPLLEQITEDRTVPRNIKDKITESVKELKDEEHSASIRVNTVVSVLDEISNDPNIPMYTRTQIWNVVSALEAEAAREDSKN
jgi:uncharacterized protein